MSIATCPHCGVKMFPRDGVCSSCNTRLDSPLDPAAPPIDPNSRVGMSGVPKQSTGTALFLMGLGLLVGLFGLAVLSAVFGDQTIPAKLMFGGLGIFSLCISALAFKVALS